MRDPAQTPAERPVERAAYVPPPATLPMPAVLVESVTPAPPVPELAPPESTLPGSVTQPMVRPIPPPPPPVLPPVPAAPRTGLRRLVGIGVVVLVLLVGVGLGIGLGRTSNDQPGPVAIPDTSTGTSTPPGPSPTQSVTIATTVPAPSPPTPARPVTPEQALTLTDQQSMDELHMETDEAAAQVAGLVGAWVPQVSSKCLGISVDIGPNWVPDGVDETAHVTLQQIVAFHLSLHNRFNAVTLLPTQAGLASDLASAGPCAGNTVWMSAVPQRFADAAEVNAWCDANVPPIRECGARYFAGPGERSTLVLRHR